MSVVPVMSRVPSKCQVEIVKCEDLGVRRALLIGSGVGIWFYAEV